MARLVLGEPHMKNRVFWILVSASFLAATLLAWKLAADAKLINPLW